MLRGTVPPLPPRSLSRLLQSIHHQHFLSTSKAKAKAKKTSPPKSTPPAPTPVKSKAKAKAKSRPTHTAPHPQPQPQTQPQTPISNVANRAFVIETRVPFWQAKFRAPQSTPVVLCIVAFAASSLYFSSTAIAPPPPTPAAEPTQTPSSSSSFTSTITAPIRFILRPIFASADERDAAQDNWRYYAGIATGGAALVLAVSTHLIGPRYVKYMAIVPPAGGSAASAGAGAVGSAGKAAAGAKTTKRGTGTGTARVEIYSAFRRHPISCPISQTTLVSPLLDPSLPRSSSPSSSASPSPSSSSTTPTPPPPPTPSLRTLRILGPPSAPQRLGWGLCMYRGGGARVNGAVLTQYETVALLERVWVDNGGRIDVARG